MKNITVQIRVITTCLMLLLFCGGVKIFAQPYTLANPYEINSFPHTISIAGNTSDGETATGMQGTCTPTCCSVYVAKVTVPAYGSLRCEMTNFTPLAASIIGYTSTVPTPTSYSDLEYYSAWGNFCGFRDTMQLGSSYSYTANSWDPTADINDPNDVIAPGTYYILFWNYNSQSGSGGGPTDFTFDFVPYCPAGYSCGVISEFSCSGDGYISPSGNLISTSGNYTDTVVGVAAGGTDSLYFINFTMDNTSFVQDTLHDLIICENEETFLNASTEYTSYGNFVKANQNWVECNSVLPAIAGTNRSMFMWIRQSSTVSGSSQYIANLNTSSGGNECLFGINTSEKINMYDGANSHSSTTSVTDGNWHYVGYTYDEATNETKIYVDGVVENTYTNGQSTTTSSHLSLGQEYDSGLSKGNFYDGEMTEVSVWNEVLTETEVALIMNRAIESTHPKYANLQAYYPMITTCQSDNSIIVDHSPNGNHGNASHSDIQILDDLTQIVGFNAVPHYNVEWLKGGTSISTNETLTLAGNLSDAGNYQMKLSRDYFTITDDWTLTVNPAPVFSQQPTDVTTSLGSNATFTSTTSGGTYTYQWYEKGYQFINKTTADGLGDNDCRGVYESNGVLYVTTNEGGLAISTDGGTSFITKTTVDGLGSNFCQGVYGSNGVLYVGTDGGLSISTDGGNSFTNKTTVDGLGHNICNNAYESNGVLYVATFGGISISTDGGNTFTNKTTVDGLGHNVCNNVYESNGVLYVATAGGLSISTDGGNTFTNKTTVDGLGANFCYDVYESNGVLYIGTSDKLSISTDGGNTFTNKTAVDGLGANFCYDIYESNGVLYVATAGGISISTDGGNTFTNKTTVDGLGSDFCQGVYESNGTLYVATVGGLSISESNISLSGETASNLTISNIAANDTTRRFFLEVTDPVTGCTAYSDTVQIHIGSACTPTTGVDVQTVCDSFVWIDGNTYTSSNNSATYVLTNAAGCDSTVTLDLTINYSNTGTDVITTCNSYTWIDGNTYTSSNNTATHVLTNVAGCDSTVALDLTINYSSTGTDVITACNSYTWIDGNTYTSSNNTATHVLTNVAGCDSTVTLDLTINYSSTGTDVITACNSYTWIDGNTYTSSNNTATYTLINSVGCDSIVTLDLTINTVLTSTDVQMACDSYTWVNGITYTSSTNTPTVTFTSNTGCDSIVTLDLTISTVTMGTDIQTACDSYTWIDGNTYTSSTNTPTITLTNAAGCDSIVALDLTILPDLVGTITDTVCFGGSITVNGTIYSTNVSGATEVFTNVGPYGCDSTVTINLTVLPELESTMNEVVCQGDDVVLNGNTYNSTGTYTEIFTGIGSLNCDSTVTLNLSVLDPSQTIIYDTICAGDSLIVDGVSYTTSNPSIVSCAGINTTHLTVLAPISSSQNITICDGETFTIGINTYSTSGTYADVLTAVSGCDSTVTTNLTVLPAVTSTDTHVACEKYTWIDGITYPSSNNTATYVIPNGAANGCDSTVILDLTINMPTYGVDIQEACDFFTWINGSTYESSNNSATYILTNSLGCDSVVTLDLTINRVDVSITTTDPTITADADGAGVTYQWIDCDNGNAIIAGETSQSFTATANGNYAVEVTNDGCVDTSDCVAILSVELLENQFESSVHVFPNPTNGYVTVDLGAEYLQTEVQVFDMHGKLLMFHQIRERKMFGLNLDYPSGTYFIEIKSADNIVRAKLIIM